MIKEQNQINSQVPASNTEGLLAPLSLRVSESDGRLWRVEEALKEEIMNNELLKASRSSPLIQGLRNPNANAQNIHSIDQLKEDMLNLHRRLNYQRKVADDLRYLNDEAFIKIQDLEERLTSKEEEIRRLRNRQDDSYSVTDNLVDKVEFEGVLDELNRLKVQLDSANQAVRYYEDNIAVIAELSDSTETN